MGAPIFLLTLIGGAMADHFDRRRIIGSLQSILMFRLVPIVALILTHQIKPWMIIALSRAVGVTDASSLLSFQSTVPSIVRHEQIPSAIALNSTQFNVYRVLGPSLAGVLMISVGAAGAFAVSAASYIPFILVALWILPHPSQGQPDGEGFSRSRRPLTFAGCCGIPASAARCRRCF